VIDVKKSQFVHPDKSGWSMVPMLYKEELEFLNLQPIYLVMAGRT